MKPENTIVMVKPENMIVMVKDKEGAFLFLQEVGGTELLPKVMAEIMKYPQGDERSVVIAVNNDPITFKKGCVDIRAIAMILNDLRLPITRKKKETCEECENHIPHAS